MQDARYPFIHRRSTAAIESGQTRLFKGSESERRYGAQEDVLQKWGGNQAFTYYGNRWRWGSKAERAFLGGMRQNADVNPILLSTCEYLTTQELFPTPQQVTDSLGPQFLAADEPTKARQRAKPFLRKAATLQCEILNRAVPFGAFELKDDQIYIVQILANAFTPGGAAELTASAQEECVMAKSDALLYMPMGTYGDTKTRHPSDRYDPKSPLQEAGGSYRLDGLTIVNKDETDHRSNCSAIFVANPDLRGKVGGERQWERLGSRQGFDNFMAANYENIRMTLEHTASILEQNPTKKAVLDFGALGCGVFQNPPHWVAAAYRLCLEETCAQNPSLLDKLEIKCSIYEFYTSQLGHLGSIFNAVINTLPLDDVYEMTTYGSQAWKDILDDCYQHSKWIEACKTNSHAQKTSSPLYPYFKQHEADLAMAITSDPDVQRTIHPEFSMHATLKAQAIQLADDLAHDRPAKTFPTFQPRKTWEARFDSACTLQEEPTENWSNPPGSEAQHVINQVPSRSTEVHLIQMGPYRQHTTDTASEVHVCSPDLSKDPKHIEALFTRQGLNAYCLQTFQTQCQTIDQAAEIGRITQQKVQLNLVTLNCDDTQIPPFLSAALTRLALEQTRSALNDKMPVVHVTDAESTHPSTAQIFQSVFEMPLARVQEMVVYDSPTYREQSLKWAQTLAQSEAGQPSLALQACQKYLIHVTDAGYPAFPAAELLKAGLPYDTLTHTMGYTPNDVIEGIFTVLLEGATSPLTEAEEASVETTLASPYNIQTLIQHNRIPWAILHAAGLSPVIYDYLNTQEDEEGQPRPLHESLAAYNEHMGSDPIQTCLMMGVFPLSTIQQAFCFEKTRPILDAVIALMKKGHIAELSANEHLSLDTLAETCSKQPSGILKTFIQQHNLQDICTALNVEKTVLKKSGISPAEIWAHNINPRDCGYDQDECIAAWIAQKKSPPSVPQLIEWGIDPATLAQRLNANASKLSEQHLRLLLTDDDTLLNALSPECQIAAFKHTPPSAEILQKLLIAGHNTQELEKILLKSMGSMPSEQLTALLLIENPAFLQELSEKFLTAALTQIPHSTELIQNLRSAGHIPEALKAAGLNAKAWVQSNPAPTGNPGEFTPAELLEACQTQAAYAGGQNLKDRIHHIQLLLSCKLSFRALQQTIDGVALYRYREEIAPAIKALKAEQNWTAAQFLKLDATATMLDHAGYPSGEIVEAIQQQALELEFCLNTRGYDANILISVFSEATIQAAIQKDMSETQADEKNTKIQSYLYKGFSFQTLQGEHCTFTDYFTAASSLDLTALSDTARTTLAASLKALKLEDLIKENAPLEMLLAVEAFSADEITAARLASPHDCSLEDLTFIFQHAGDALPDYTDGFFHPFQAEGQKALLTQCLNTAKPSAALLINKAFPKSLLINAAYTPEELKTALTTISQAITPETMNFVQTLAKVEQLHKQGFTFDELKGAGFPAAVLSTSYRAELLACGDMEYVLNSQLPYDQIQAHLTTTTGFLSTTTTHTYPEAKIIQTLRTLHQTKPDEQKDAHLASLRKRGFPPSILWKALQATDTALKAKGVKLDEIWADNINPVECGYPPAECIDAWIAQELHPLQQLIDCGIDAALCAQKLAKSADALKPDQLSEVLLIQSPELLQELSEKFLTATFKKIPHSTEMIQNLLTADYTLEALKTAGLNAKAWVQSNPAPVGNPGGFSDEELLEACQTQAPYDADRQNLQDRIHHIQLLLSCGLSLQELQAKHRGHPYYLYQEEIKPAITALKTKHSWTAARFLELDAMGNTLLDAGYSPDDISTAIAAHKPKKSIQDHFPNKQYTMEMLLKAGFSEEDIQAAIRPDINKALGPRNKNTKIQSYINKGFSFEILEGADCKLLEYFTAASSLNPTALSEAARTTLAESLKALQQAQLKELIQAGEPLEKLLAVGAFTADQITAARLECPHNYSLEDLTFIFQHAGDALPEYNRLAASEINPMYFEDWIKIAFENSANHGNLCSLMINKGFPKDLLIKAKPEQTALPAALSSISREILLGSMSDEEVSEKVEQLHTQGFTFDELKAAGFTAAVLSTSYHAELLACRETDYVVSSPLTYDEISAVTSWGSRVHSDDMIKEAISKAFREQPIPENRTALLQKFITRGFPPEMLKGAGVTLAMCLKVEEITNLNEWGYSDAEIFQTLLTYKHSRTDQPSEASARYLIARGLPSHHVHYVFQGAPMPAASGSQPAAAPAAGGALATGGAPSPTVAAKLETATSKPRPPQAGGGDGSKAEGSPSSKAR